MGVLERGPTTLSFSDHETLSEESNNSVKAFSISTSVDRTGRDSDCTTVLWAASASSGQTDSLDYIDACRQLGPSPMVQPTKCRRCYSYSRSTKASCGTLDCGHHIDSSLISMNFDS